MRRVDGSGGTGVDEMKLLLTVCELLGELDGGSEGSSSMP